jgi:hypothetical protein
MIMKNEREMAQIRVYKCAPNEGAHGELSFGETSAVVEIKQKQ